MGQRLQRLRVVLTMTEWGMNEVARAWQAIKKMRRTKRKERKAPEEKDGRKRKGRAKILVGAGKAALSDLSGFGSDSGNAISSLSSIADSDSSSGGSRGSGSGSGRDSGSSGSGSSGSSSDSDSDSD